MRSFGFGFGVTMKPGATGGGAAPADPNLWPDPDVDDATGYAFQTNTSFDTSSLRFNGATATQTVASLAGSALNTAALAAIAPSTPYQVRLMVSDWVANDVGIRLRFGTYVALGATGDGWFGPVTVTSGVGATGVLQIRGHASGATLRIQKIEILP